MVHLFESAIDLLSYVTLQKSEGKEWREEHLLSLAGVYQPAKGNKKSSSVIRCTRSIGRTQEETLWINMEKVNSKRK
jgi:hypothetical protein